MRNPPPNHTVSPISRIISQIVEIEYLVIRMAITKLTSNMKTTALLSLIVIPIWSHITSSGDKNKGSGKQPKSGVTTGGKAQQQELYYRYHGSKYLRSTDEDAESHVRCFMNMIGPYEAVLLGTALSRSDSDSQQDPNPLCKQILLDLSRIMRIEKIKLSWVGRVSWLLNNSCTGKSKMLPKVTPTQRLFQV